MLKFWFTPRRIKRLSVFFFSLSLATAEEIRVCLKEGDSARSVTAGFRSGYRGVVYAQKDRKRWFLINQLDLEEYVTGVVGNEMGPEWPTEALKAQAICARTVALVRKEQARQKGCIYDLTMTHQLYGQCEHENVVTAVEETRDMVLTFEGKPVLVFYHTCCGGSTTAAGNVWTGTWPWLQPVTGCCCSDAPYAAWQRVFSLSYLSRALGFPVKQLFVSEMDTSGRVRSLTVVSTTGKIQLSAAELRSRINKQAGVESFQNQSTLPSTFFTFLQEGQNFIFQGRGYGHGVGLCQWGAKKMAEAGAGYLEILHFYFPSLTVKRKGEKEVYGDKSSSQGKS